MNISFTDTARFLGNFIATHCHSVTKTHYHPDYGKTSLIIRYLQYGIPEMCSQSRADRYLTDIGN